MLPALISGTALGFLGAVPVAGPVSAIILRFALRKQARRAGAVALGAALAEAFYVLLAFFGFNLLLESVPHLQSISKYLTSAIIGALGIYFMVSKTTSAPHGTAPAEPKGKKSAFGVGFGISILNPTLVATWSTVIASLYSYQLFPYSVSNAILFSAGVAVGIIAWFAVMLHLIHRNHDRLNPMWIRRMLICMGAMLVGLSVGNLIR